MEKYRKYSDASTGCNPFLPVELVKTKRLNQYSRVALGILTVILGVVRAPLMILSSLLLITTDMFSMLPILSQLVVVPVFRPVFGWLLLFSLGIISPLAVKVDDFRRLLVRKPSGKSTNAHGIVSSFHGMIDVLVHAVCTRPNCFVFYSLDGSVLVCETLIGALKEASSCPQKSYGTDSISKAPRGSVIFVSPSPTNGLGVLKLDYPLFEKLLAACDFQLASVKYSCYGSHYPHHLTETGSKHILNLMFTNMYCSVVVNTLPDPINDVTKISKLMARLSVPSCVETQIDPSTYLEFLSYWRETQSLNYAVRKSQLL
jgi:hypothetical protein